MRKTALVLFFAVITVFVAACIYADCGNMKGDKDPKSGGQCSMMMDEANCPFCVKGAVVKVVNTKDGIQVLVTAADKSAIKEIQEKGGKFMKACGEKTESS